ncbi:unnamed protein product [Rotaria socialis]|uniref:PDZ domain-containing protein n=1 Tax=Rotaria socialis TaxID=392032 RepID=A0A820B5N1_9BILA|nr:unnamed protein product [Rotaria socialis]CAF4193864.1 unnamed protein product [Rotaria socialis]
MVLNTLWTQIEVVDLINDGSGLGFGISGNQSTGVVVKAIVPGSIADKDGRIHTGDHLFQINHVYVRGMNSEQVAGILRQSSEQVRLVVARSIREPTAAINTAASISENPSLISENAIRTRNSLSSMMNDSEGIINNSQNKILLRTERLLESNHSLEKILNNLLNQCQYEDGTEILDVTLEKGDDGLGITVAGYVSPDSTNDDAIAGIFIRDIAEGSACFRDGRLAIGDQIIEVNDQSLNGFSNVQALYLLQNTHSSVRLKIRRYLDGVKYEKIKEMISLESSNQIEEKLEFQNKSNIHEQIRDRWIKILGNNYEIFIIDIYKPDNGSLGITLEGTVDVENGEKIGAHHYIRALLPEGIIGMEATLISGDELLEINNQVLYGKNHLNVIEILKRVKNDIKLVCARRHMKQSREANLKPNANRSRSISFCKSTEIVVKAKSMGTLDAANSSFLRTTKTRSLEIVSNLALWSTSVLNIELNKGDHGLGFSVLDYQDPSNPSYSPVIVIRSLVAGGVAQLDGRLIPGDRLVAVNDITLENMNLDDVIKILKSTPKGPVKLSLSKPLPYPKFKNDNDDKIITDSDQDVKINQRLSRISKSKTTAEIMNNHKRSASSHRSINAKPAVSPGITLSAPAILSRYEYVETLLHKESLQEKPKKSIHNDAWREKSSKKTLSFKTTELKSENDDKLNTKLDINSLPSNHYQSDLSLVNHYANLPEFSHFQFDHFLLASRSSSYSSNERLRNSSTFSSSKFNRQSNASQTTTTATANTGVNTPTKRASRSRHSNDTTKYYEKQNQQKHSKRSMMNKFDSLSYFNEPDLSTDDSNNLIYSSTTNHRHSVKNNTHSKPLLNDNVCEINDMKQQDELLSDNNNNNNNNNSTIPTAEQSKRSSSSRQSSRMASPALSTSSQSSGRVITLLNHEVIQIPIDLEREISIKHNFDELGLVLDASVDDGVNGCYVRSINLTSNNIYLQPGDFILSINNENMRKISNAQARAIIRRASLIGSDIGIIYIVGEEAKQFKDQILDSQLIPLENLDSDIEAHQSKANLIDDDKDSPILIDSESLCSTLWGAPRTVILYRDEQIKNLGISIVGGKLDFSGPGNTIESCISGIFVKHVIPDSIAGRKSTLKTGDRILEVNGYNLRDATHDHAVEIIRSAQSPIYFIVQSLFDASSPSTHLPPPIEDNQIIKQYEHLNGEVLLIDIKRNSSEINEPLGLSLIGHRDPYKLAVFVCDIQLDSLVSRDNRLELGDQLLQVNDEILLGKAHSVVTSIIKSIKSETLNFVILRNPNAMDDMALRSPYKSIQHHDISHANEHKENDDRLTSKSDFPFNKHIFDNKKPMKNKNSFNKIKTTNIVDNDNVDRLLNNNFTDSLACDMNKSLFNKQHNELLPTSSSNALTHVNNDRNHQLIANVTLPIVSKQTIDYNAEIKDSFVSHIPMMSSSSSSSSLSNPKPLLDQQVPVKSEPLVITSNGIEDNPRTKPIIVGQETLIEIDRGEFGLGLSVVGGSDTQLSAIIIHDIYEGCATQRDGRLLVGDRILEVNSIDLRSATHEEAMQALRQTTSIIRMVVLRREMINEEDKFDVITVDFIKKSGKGLGFSIIGRRHGFGVFISHIIEGGSAEKDGRLMSGDLILEVNEKDLRLAAYEQVAYTLKTLPHGRVYIKIGRLKVNADEYVASSEHKHRSCLSSTNKTNDR